jgi:glycosyltransferase involved in cell wall biosynthesis
MPAYNEEANISPQVLDVLAALRPLSDDFEVIVVNDGSRDRTAQMVKELQTQYAQVRLIEHPVNQGYGAALFSGFMGATKELVFLTDSDRQFDLNDLQRLMPLLANADLIAGYRNPRRDPLMRVLNGKGWSALVTLLFGYTARDIDCAFKLFRREILDHIKLESRGATFSAEFLVRAKLAGYRIAEIGVAHHPRRAGSQTGARPDVILRAFRELFWMRWRMWFKESP